MKVWELPEYFQENCDGLGLNYVRFILNQSEKYLNETVRTGDIITDKAHRILGISITILAGALIYIINSVQPNITIYISSILASLLSILVAGLLIKPLRSYRIQVSGAQPYLLLDKDFIIGCENNDEAQEKRIILNECVETPKRIRFNESNNKERTEQVDFCMYLLLLVPLVLPLVWILEVCGSKFFS